MIRVENLRFGFGTQEVLRGLAFEVRQGEVLGVLGPNGSGKSTLLKLLRGALVPGSGQVLLEGRPVHRCTRRTLARRIAVVPQALAVPFPFTVWETVAMGRFAHRRGLAGLSRTDRAAVERALAWTDTLHLAARTVTELSGGELQRVFLARALAQEAPVLLLDEVTSHLDIRHRLQVAELLVRLNREEGRTVVHVTHDFDLAAEISHRLLLLGPLGEPEALGPPAEVLRPERLHRAFGISVRVEPDPLTGGPRVFPLLRGRQPVHLDRAVHVVCGGGSGGEILRRLVLARARVSAGPLNRGDTDAELCRALGIRAVLERPFSPVGERALSGAGSLMRAADAVVVGPVPWGPGNVRILETVERVLEAGRPVFLVDPSPERDFSGGRAREALRRLEARGARRVVDARELVEALAGLSAG